MAKITNEQKYKTAEERNGAYAEYCGSRVCKECELHDKRFKELTCAFNWLALEAEEKPEPCFYCGEQMTFTEYGIACRCGYTKVGASREASIAAHNRVARAVKAAKEGEVK